MVCIVSIVFEGQPTVFPQRAAQKMRFLLGLLFFPETAIMKNRRGELGGFTSLFFVLQGGLGFAAQNDLVQGNTQR